VTTIADYLPVRPAYVHAETSEIQPCAFDLAPHSLLVAIRQGGELTPDVAPYRLVVHPTAAQLAMHFAYMVFGTHWPKQCEIAMDSTFGWSINE
jgi:hypothetical protein